MPIFVPALYTSGSPHPTLGTGGFTKIEYNNIGGRCMGTITIRFGSNMTRGNGVYRIQLPEPVQDIDNKKIQMIGSYIIGDGNSPNHPAHGSLHRNGYNPGAHNKQAVMVPSPGSFVTDDYPEPGGTLGNIHAVFNYPIAGQ